MLIAPCSLLLVFSLGCQNEDRPKLKSTAGAKLFFTGTTGRFVSVEAAADGSKVVMVSVTLSGEVRDENGHALKKVGNQVMFGAFSDLNDPLERWHTHGIFNGSATAGQIVLTTNDLGQFNCPIAIRAKSGYLPNGQPLGSGSGSADPVTAPPFVRVYFCSDLPWVGDNAPLWHFVMAGDNYHGWEHPELLATSGPVCQPAPQALAPCDCGQPGDLDGDSDVDQSDFAVIQRCYDPSPAGPGLLPICQCADLNQDGRVGREDVHLFASCVSGPALAARPDCLTTNP